MEKRKFECRRCGHVFIIEVLTEKEKKEGRRGSPVRCPKCQSMELNMH